MLRQLGYFSHFLAEKILNLFCCFLFSEIMKTFLLTSIILSVHLTSSLTGTTGTTGTTYGPTTTTEYPSYPPHDNCPPTVTWGGGNRIYRFVTAQEFTRCDAKIAQCILNTMHITIRNSTAFPGISIQTLNQKRCMLKTMIYSLNKMYSLDLLVSKIHPPIILQLPLILLLMLLLW